MDSFGGGSSPNSSPPQNSMFGPSGKLIRHHFLHDDNMKIAKILTRTWVPIPGFWSWFCRLVFRYLLFTPVFRSRLIKLILQVYSLPSLRLIWMRFPMTRARCSSAASPGRPRPRMWGSISPSSGTWPRWWWWRIRPPGGQGEQSDCSISDDQ